MTLFLLRWLGERQYAFLGWQLCRPAFQWSADFAAENHQPLSPSLLSAQRTATSTSATTTTTKTCLITDDKGSHGKAGELYGDILRSISVVVVASFCFVACEPGQEQNLPWIFERMK